MRWRYDDPPLVWLFVAAFAAHLVEEWFGGFPEWYALIAGRPLPRMDFIVINGAALVAMIVAARISTTRASFGWLAIAIAAIAFINGLAHLLGSLITAMYSPGLITGVVLYLPLGLLALLRAWHQAPPSFFWRGVIAGATAHAIVVLIAFGSA